MKPARNAEYLSMNLPTGTEVLSVNWNQSDSKVRPLLILPGLGVGVDGMGHALLDQLAADRPVIVVGNKNAVASSALRQRVGRFVSNALNPLSYLSPRTNPASPWNDAFEPITMQEYASDISSTIRFLGIRTSVDIFGHSWGGAEAIATAINHPDQVNKLIVAATPAPGNLFDTPNYTLWDAYMYGLNTPGSAGRIFGGSLKRDPGLLGRLGIEPMRTDPYIACHLSAMVFNTSREQFESSRIPLLAIGGDDDPLVPANHVHAFFKINQHYTETYIHRAEGHFSPQIRHDTTAKIINDFLSDTPSAAVQQTYSISKAA